MKHILERPGARYTFEYDTLMGHFGINCNCSGTTGIILKGDDEFAERTISRYTPCDTEARNKYGFYLNKLIFRNMLKGCDEKPLELVCGVCKRTFSFTPQSFSDLEKQALREGTREDD